MSFWSLQKGKITMALVAVVGDAAVVKEEDIVEETMWTMLQPQR